MIVLDGDVFPIELRFIFQAMVAGPSLLSVFKRSVGG